jgi:hypothetical protein
MYVPSFGAFDVFGLSGLLFVDLSRVISLDLSIHLSTLIYNNFFVNASVSDPHYFYLDLDRIQPKMDPECGLGSGFEYRNLQKIRSKY